MSATEVIEWIALGSRRTWEELVAEQREYEDWCLSLPVDEVLQAATSMAAPEPFCVWLPYEADILTAASREKRRYLHLMGSPSGPVLLEQICARLTSRYGRPVSVAELAERIEAETGAFFIRCKARNAAKNILIDRMVRQNLTAWGRPDDKAGQPNPRARLMPVPPEMLMSDALALDGDRLTSPQSLGHGEPGRGYSNLRFTAAEVAALWPAPTGDARCPSGSKPRPQNSDGVKRRATTRGYAVADAPLIAEMREMIRDERATGPWNAARQVAPRAKGSLREDSRVTRLYERYSKLLRAGHFGED